jgi:hypothetical protein
MNVAATQISIPVVVGALVSVVLVLVVVVLVLVLVQMVDVTGSQRFIVISVQTLNKR